MNSDELFLQFDLKSEESQLQNQHNQHFSVVDQCGLNE